MYLATDTDVSLKYVHPDIFIVVVLLFQKVSKSLVSNQKEFKYLIYNFFSTIQLEQLPKSVLDVVELKALFG